MSEQHQNFRRLISHLGESNFVGDGHIGLIDLDRANFRNDWDAIQVRQRYPGSAHVDTQMIPLRGPETLENLFDNLDCVDYPNASLFPCVWGMVGEVCRFLKARELGRVMLVRLKGGGKILPHVDEGAYARYFARFHVALTSSPDCIFACGEESAYMAPGELWWFNHQVVHSVRNDARTSRTHLIMDLTAPGFTGAIANIQVP